MVTELKQETGMGIQYSLLLMQKEVTADLHEMDKNLCLK